MVSPVSGCTTAAQKCSMSTLYALSLSERSVTLPISKSLGTHTSFVLSHVLLVIMLSASCDMRLGELSGILLQLGLVFVTGYSSPGLSLGDLLGGVSSLSMGMVAMGVLDCVILWCNLCAIMTFSCEVGLVVVVTSGATPTLCGCLLLGFMLSMFSHIFLIALNTLFLDLLLSFAIDSSSSFFTSIACCSAVKVGMMQCCGYKLKESDILMDLVSGT